MALYARSVAFQVANPGKFSVSNTAVFEAIYLDGDRTDRPGNGVNGHDCRVSIGELKIREEFLNKT